MSPLPWATLTDCQTGHVHKLVKTRVTAGRDAKNDIVFGVGTEVSRCHFIIEQGENGKPTLLHDSSTNGTFVDGHQGDNVLHADGEIHVKDPSFPGGWYFIFNSKTKNFHVCQASSAVLGKGSFSIVKLGIDMKNHQRVAVKIIDTSLVPRKRADGLSIAQEISILKAMRHPNVTQIHSVESSRTHVYLYLQLVYPSVNLYSFLVGHGTVKESMARFFFFKILHALRYLHAKGICHRDLKPENILLEGDTTSTPRVLITDFGMAKVTEAANSMKTQW